MARRRRGWTIGFIRSCLYFVARILGDVQAVRKGRIGRRIGRRIAGKITGRFLGRWFR